MERSSTSHGYEETRGHLDGVSPDHIVILPGVCRCAASARRSGIRPGHCDRTNQGPRRGSPAAAVRRTNEALVTDSARRGFTSRSQRCACIIRTEGRGATRARRAGASVGNRSRGCSRRSRAPPWAHAGAHLDGRGQRGGCRSRSRSGDADGARLPDNRCELCPLRAGVDAVGRRARPTVHGATLLEVAKAIVTSTGRREG